MSFVHGLRNRHFLTTLAIVTSLIVTACSAAPASQSAQRNFTVGEVSVLPASYATTLHASLALLGYIEGKNVTYLPASAATPGATTNANITVTTPAVSPSSPAGLLAVAQTLVAAKVDLIIAYGTSPAAAAQKAVAGTNIPVVFLGALDPVGQGLVKSMQNTEGNITGVSAAPDAYAQQLEWLLRTVPTVKRVFVPYLSPQLPAIKIALQSIQDYASKSGIQILAIPLATPQDISAALTNPPDADAIMLLPYTPQESDFIKLSTQHKLPVSSYVSASVSNGALLSFNYSEMTLSNAAAPMIDAILKGANPSNFPVRLASNTLAVNLKTAQAIGITIPNDILQQSATVVR